MRPFTTRRSSSLLRFLHVDAGDGVSHSSLQHAGVAAALVKRDGEQLQARRALRDLHGNARQVLLLVVLGAPLAGLLVDDQLPAAGAGQGVNRVVTLRNAGADVQVTEVFRVVAALAPVRQT